ncbi:hypothetical protein [Anaerovibrio sp.]|uniref:hypothetical protein n=1 Tax=Anaerovibrio sp. TaxID=1872532 RepID=UPI00388ECD61
MEKNSSVMFVRLLVAMFMFAAVSWNMSGCEAAQWERVVSSATETAELDVSSIRRVHFPNAGANVVCLVKVIAADNSYVISQVALRINNGNKESAMMSCTVYDANGNVVGQDPGTGEPSAADYEIVSPGSHGEALFDKAMYYAQ